jgi:hypothetical protein
VLVVGQLDEEDVRGLQVNRAGPVRRERLLTP